MSKEQEHPVEPASVFMPSTRQIVGYRYFTAILIDLVVLNLFAEYWERVELLSFTVSLFAAILLQLSLRATFKLEHYFASFFRGKPGITAKVFRILVTWSIVFGAKLMMLGAINFAFGESLVFHGRNHGILAFIVVVVVMLTAEELIFRLFRKLSSAQSV